MGAPASTLEQQDRSVPEALRRPGRRVLLLTHDLLCCRCTGRLGYYADLADRFREAGWEPMAVVADSEAAVRDHVERYELDYEVLADPDATLIGDLIGSEPRASELLVDEGRIASETVSAKSFHQLQRAKDVCANLAAE